MIIKTVVRWVMMTSNLIAVFFMLITIIGSVLSPEKFIYPVYFALVFPISIFINIAFVVYWILSRKWYFLLSLSVLLFSAAKINSTFPVHFGETKNTRENTISGIRSN